MTTNHPLNCLTNTGHGKRLPFRFLPAMLLVCFAFTGILKAQTAPDGDQPSALVRQLDEIKRRKAELDRERNTRLVREFSEASVSADKALALYQDAVRNTRFAGDQQEEILFQKWRRENEERMEDRDEVAAMQLHLRYLAITVRRAEAPPASIVPDLIRFNEDVNRASNRIRENQWLTAPLNKSIFVSRYRLEPYIGNQREWEPVPANTDAICDKTVFPYLRETGDPALIRLWEERITRRTAEASQNTRSFNTDRFNDIARPELYWNRARDMLVVGERRRAVAEMFKILQTFPDHPRADEWIAELDAVIKP